LHAHQRVVEAHCGRCVRVGGKIQNREGCVLHRGLELGKGAQCQGRADHAGEVGQATLARAGEEQELGLSSKGWWQVLQFPDECNGLVSVTFHVRSDVVIGTNRDTGGNDPVSGMLDIKDARSLLRGLVRGGRRGAVDCALVEGGRESDSGAVLHKSMEGCSGPGPMR
jgi:hypothetical protein